MAVRFSNRKVLPIGLDPGSRKLRMVQFSIVQDKWKLLCAGACDMDADWRKDPKNRVKAMTRGVKEILKDRTFKGRQCVLSLPSELTFVHHVKVPRSGPEEFDAAIRSELEGKLPWALKDTIIRYVIGGETMVEQQSRSEVIAICVARSTVEQHLIAARRGGLDVIGANVEPCAIVECFARFFRRTADATRAVMFVDMGATGSRVVISHGGSMVFARNLSIGTDQWDRHVAREMGVSQVEAGEIRNSLSRCGVQPGGEEQKRSEDPHRADINNTRRDESDTASAGRNEISHILKSSVESLSGELTKCLRYYQSVFKNNTVERIIFVGGGAHDMNVCQSIARQLNMPAQVGDPLLLTEHDPSCGVGGGLDRRCCHPDWAVAVGLSLGAPVTRAGHAARSETAA